MSYQPIPITPFKSGLDLDNEPFQVPMDGFVDITNGHIKHGHVEKRAGYSLLAAIPNATAVMGLYTYYDNSNARTLLGFNTTRAATFDGLTLSWSLLDVADIMSSGSDDFVWAVNWQASNLNNRLYFSNGKPLSAGLDGIRYFDAVTSSITTTALTPTALGGARELYGCKLLFVLKQRLLCLNTYEFDGAQVNQYPQRLRWCQAQGPSNWNDITAGGGGFVDAPTGEHIISGRALQNGIIVFFTNSVWTIEPTTDPALPFRWKKINDFRACAGKMGSVGYDRYVAAFGDRGITATDGVETRRIDDRVENFVDNYVNYTEAAKVFMARSYQEKRMWMLYPRLEDDESSGALIYDDESASWSLYDIPMNVLGYANNGFDWRCSDFTAANDHDWTCQDAGELTCSSFFFQGNAEYFIGGDTSGNVYILESNDSDDGEDIEFVLKTGEWNPFQQQGVECQLGYIDFMIETDQETKVEVQFYKNDDEDFYQSQELDCLPDMSFICEVTNITQANPGVVTSFQHGLATGDVVYIYCVNGMEEMNTGPFTVTVIDANNFSIGTDTSAYGAYTGDGQVFGRQFYRTKAWKRAYAGGIGYGHSVRISSTGTNRPLKIFEYKPYFRPRGKRTIG